MKILVFFSLPSILILLGIGLVSVTGAPNLVGQIQDSGGTVHFDSDEEHSSHLPRLFTRRQVVGVMLEERSATDELTSQLAAFPQLDSITLIGDSVTDAGIRPLASLRELTCLTLASNSLTDGSLETVSRIRSVQFLCVFRGEFSRDGISRLSALPDLKMLSIQDVALGVPEIRSISGLRQVSLLGLNKTGIGNEEVRVLALKGVTTLNLEDNPISELPEWQAVDGQQLISLSLARTQIGNEDLERLCNFPRLGILDIRGTRVTDAAVSTLARMPSLSFLHVEDTRFSDTAKRELLKARPHCEVYRDD